MAEFLRSLTTGFNRIHSNTLLMCTLYTGVDPIDGYVNLFFDQRPHTPPEHCDFHVVLDEYGVILTAEIIDRDGLQDRRDWIRYLVDHKVPITGVMVCYGQLALELAGTATNYTQ